MNRSIGVTWTAWGRSTTIKKLAKACVRQKKKKRGVCLTFIWQKMLCKMFCLFFLQNEHYKCRNSFLYVYSVFGPFFFFFLPLRGQFFSWQLKKKGKNWAQQKWVHILMHTGVWPIFFIFSWQLKKKGKNWARQKWVHILMHTGVWDKLFFFSQHIVNEARVVHWLNWSVMYSILVYWWSFWHQNSHYYVTIKVMIFWPCCTSVSLFIITVADICFIWCCWATYL